MSAVLSIILPCHNRCAELQLALNSLCHQTTPTDRFEVIVVDQASSDNSRQVVRAFETSLLLRLIEQDAPYGPSAARNAGIEAARAALVLLLDCDMVADPDLVSAHLTCQVCHPGALACGRILPYGPAQRSFVDRVAYPERGLDRGCEDGELPFYQVFSGNLSADADCLRRIGLFDPTLPAFEDVELGYRAHRAGMTIVGCAAAAAYHNHPRTLEQRLTRARTYNRVWPELLHRYPELRGMHPFLRDYEPIHWGMDRGQRLWGKLRVRLYSSAPVRITMYEMLRLLDRAQSLPRVTKALYWRLLAINQYLGFREGAAALRPRKKPA